MLVYGWFLNCGLPVLVLNKDLCETSSPIHPNLRGHIGRRPIRGRTLCDLSHSQDQWEPHHLMMIRMESRYELSYPTETDLTVFFFLILNLPIGSTCVIWSTKSRFPKYTVILPFDELFLKTLHKVETNGIELLAFIARMDIFTRHQAVEVIVAVIRGRGKK